MVYIKNKFSNKKEVKSIGNPAGIGKGTGFGLRERERDGIGLGHYRLRASNLRFAKKSWKSLVKKLTCKNWIQADCRITYSHQECRMGYIDRAINHNREKRTLSSSDFLLEVFSQTIPYWDLCTFAGRHTACALLWKRIQPYIHCLVYFLSSTLPWDDLSLFWCCHLDGYLTGILKIITPEILQNEILKWLDRTTVCFFDKWPTKKCKVTFDNCFWPSFLCSFTW